MIYCFFYVIVEDLNDLTEDIHTKLAKWFSLITNRTIIMYKPKNLISLLLQFIIIYIFC